MYIKFDLRNHEFLESVLRAHVFCRLTRKTRAFGTAAKKSRGTAIERVQFVSPTSSKYFRIFL